MNGFIGTLEKITFQNGFKNLTFGIEHVVKTMQMMTIEKYVSRATLCRELRLGEGSVKTIISHLKKSGYASSIKSGTFLLENGWYLINEISKFVPSETSIKKSKFLPSEYNYAILLRNFADYIIDGMDQRDFAVKFGATGALTTTYHNYEFRIATSESFYLIVDKETEKTLIKHLQPKEGDVVIITFASNEITAELAAKSSALYTIDIKQTVSTYT